jgi:hypothetical protein
MIERATILADNVWQPGQSSYSVFYMIRFPDENYMDMLAGVLPRPRPSDCELIVPGTLEEAPEAEHEYWPQALARLHKD